MSGLFGFYNLNGHSLDQDVLIRARAAMHRRGSLFKNVSQSGLIGLGFTANHPSEGSFYSHSETSVVVVADARLDNMQELTKVLNLKVNSSFAEVIAKAYLKWDTDCSEHLDGDFAFMIWDPRHNHLFAARDRLGLKQLLYHYSPNKVFGCATDAIALFAHEDIQRRLCEARLLDFFVGTLEGIDKTCTAYETVKRLPPGHKLLLKDGQLSISSYWNLVPQVSSNLKTQNEFVEAFQALLSIAVARRFDSLDTTGVMVSGGMDSSAAAAIAVHQFGPGVKTFSAINTADPFCIETCMIDLVNRHLGVISNSVDLAAREQWLGYAKSGLAEISDPFDSNMNLMRGVCGAAKHANMTVLMDGAWGDTIFAPGAHVRRLMRAGQLIAAQKALKADRDYHGDVAAFLPIYSKMLISSFLPSVVKSNLAPLKYKLHAVKLKHMLRLTDEFVNRHNLEKRLKELDSHSRHYSWRNPDAEAAEIVSHPYHIVARERYDRVASHFGLIMRDPYTDLDLVKFCLSLPTIQKTANGIPKSLLRNAMNGQLPEPIISRLSKEHLGYKFTQQVYSTVELVLKKPSLDLPSMVAIDRQTKYEMTDDFIQNLYFATNWVSRNNR